MGTRLTTALCAGWLAACGLGSDAAHDGPPQGIHLAPAAQGAPATGRAPLSLTASDGTGLSLRALTAKVVLEPPLAFTQLELAFDNPLPRRLEGRFEIALPPGAAISRLALQIGETYQEGEVVERQQARVAYEEALHGRRDPALLERDAGNEYRVRVFPIEANATKHLIVSYSQVLDDAGAPYRLHLHGLPTIERARVEVAHARGRRELFTRERWQPPGDLLVPVGEQPQNMALRSGELALIQVTPLSAMEPAPIERLTVLLDTSASSASRLDTYVARLRELTAEISARTRAPLPIQLVVFDQEAIPLLQTRSDRLGEELEALLRERGALGATDLHAALETLATLPELGDRLWIFSDGIATAGRDGVTQLRAAASALAERGVTRLDVIASAEVLDRPRLQGLVTAGLPAAGVVITDETAEAAVDRALTQTRSDVEVEVSGASWIYPTRLPAVEAGRRYSVFARLPERQRLHVRLDGQLVSPMVALQTRAGELLEREWARMKIEYLQRKLEAADAGDAERIRARLVEISREHRVLSDHTALVVLESEADYRRHRIERSDVADVLVVDDGRLVAARSAQPVRDTLFHEPFLQDEGDAVAPADGEGDAPAPPPLLGDARPPAGAPLPRDANTGALGAPRDRGYGVIGSAGGLARGEEQVAALGALMGDAATDASFGFGGLATKGIGRGAGGTATGTIGTIGSGAIGTIGAGNAGSFRGRNAQAPRVRTGKAQVQGALSQEVVRRIVRRHINEVRFCYEQTLHERPDLEGQVVIRFIILPTGAVHSAAVKDSTLQHAKVELCIADAVRRWAFPSPEGGGIVQVTYPFELQRSQVSAARMELADARAQQRRRLRAERQREARLRAEQRREARLRTEQQREWKQRPRPQLADALDGPLLEVAQQLERGELDAALARARRWQREAPRDPMALLGLGRAAQATGRLELAARAYGSLIDLFPSRADMLRAAGQRLESLGDGQLQLAQDSYRRAVALRPDHASGHRLLAMAQHRAGLREAALQSLRVGQQRGNPLGRFPDVETLLASDDALLRDGPGPALRICLYWESDATNLDLHVYDRAHRHVHAGRTRSAGGGQLVTEMRRGYGPECFAARGDELAFPYTIQVHYRARGPMGHSMAALHVLRRSEDGQLQGEMRPFVVMAEDAWVDLGSVDSAQTVIASAAP